MPLHSYLVFGFYLFLPLWSNLIGEIPQEIHTRESTYHFSALLPSDIKWVDAPNSLPKGAKVATLEGNWNRPGPFTIRLKVPANYIFPPHWHIANEEVTILEGTYEFGMGDKLNFDNAKKYPPFSFLLIPDHERHFFRAKGETTIQIHGHGPWIINYVNPKDDPRKQK